MRHRSHGNNNISHRKEARQQLAPIVREEEHSDIMLEDSYSVIEDIQGYLNKRNSLPKYVSKERIFTELSNILFAKRAKPDKKLEALQLIDVLETKIKSESEINSAYAILVPAVLSQIGSPFSGAQKASIDILQRVTERRGQVLLDQLASNGIDNADDRISIESLKLVPGIFYKKMENMDLAPIFEKSFKQLTVKSRQNQAVGALNRLKESLGDERFDKMTAYSVPEKLRTIFYRMSKNLDEQNNYGGIRRKLTRDSFGIIPSHITKSLYNPYNRNIRAEGITKLKEYLEGVSPEDWSLIFPYMDSFLRFLGSLLDDPNVKVVMTSLEIHQILLFDKQTAEEVRDHFHIIIKNVLNIRPQLVPRINVELYQLLKLMMASIGPGLVVNAFSDELHHRKASKREDILNYIIYGLLTFPSSEFDLHDLLGPLIISLNDPKKRVRHAATECVAVVSQALGPHKNKVIYKIVSELVKSPIDSDKIIEALQCRFSRKILPKITEDGSIEYGLQIPRQFSRRQLSLRYPPSNEPDIDWIVEGKGSLRQGDVMPSNGRRPPKITVKGIQKSHSTNSLQSEMTTARKPRKPWAKKSRSKQGNQQRSLSENSEALPHNQLIYQSLSSRENSSSSLSVDRNKIPEDYSDVEEPRLTYSDSEIEDSFRRRKVYGYTDTRGNSFNESLPRRSLFHEEESVAEEDLKGKKEGIDFKRESLTSLGIPTRKNNSYKTSFKFDDPEMNTLMKKGPEEVIEIAMAKLKSGDWRYQISGIEVVVHLLHLYSNVNLQHYLPVLNSLMSLAKSPRSQVARAAIQSFTCLFLDLGLSSDTNKLEDVADVLLLKSSDSNKFIRSDTQDALEALLNNVPVQKASHIFCRLSSLHKVESSRSSAAKLLGDLVLQLGRERLYASYFVEDDKETLESIVSSGAQFLLEGNAESRVEGKRLLTELSRDSHAFEAVLHEVLKSDKEVDSVYKHLR